MSDKSSTEMEELSDDSENEKILDLLSDKLPYVEEALTSSLNVIQEIVEEENEKFNERIDFIEAFKGIIEIYDLTKGLINSYYNKKTLVQRIKNIKYKYLDLKSNYKSLILETKQRDENLRQNEEILREAENENYELKMKVQELNIYIKCFKEVENEEIVLL